MAMVRARWENFGSGRARTVEWFVTGRLPALYCRLAGYMAFSSLDFFWVSSTVSQLVIAVVMLRRKLHREFPMFFSYTLFRATTALLIFFLLRFHILIGTQYEYAFWPHEIGCIILRFAIIYELFRVLAKPHSDLEKSTFGLLRWGTAALFFLSVMIAFLLRNSPYYSKVDVGLTIIDRTVDIVQVGLLLMMLLLLRYFRISWRSYSFGIAVGLGVFSAIDITIQLGFTQTGAIVTAHQRQLAALLDLVSMIAYQACVLIWLVYALLPEPAPTVVTQLPEHDLDSWRHELQRIRR